MKSIVEREATVAAYQCSAVGLTQRSRKCFAGSGSPIRYVNFKINFLTCYLNDAWLFQSNGQSPKRLINSLPGFFLE